MKKINTKSPWNRLKRHLIIKFARLLPDRKYLELIFPLRIGYPLNLDNPKTFSEKLQWLKLYDRKPIYTKMVDKYEAKKYVAGIIGEEYIIPTLAIYDRVEDIDFDAMPNQFVLKCTHDSGGLVICKDKTSLDKAAAINKIKDGLKRNYFYQNREWPYKNVKPRIIAEAYMEDSTTSELRDYKFFCFDGVVKALFIAEDRQKKGEETKFDFFDADFRHLDIRNGHPNAGTLPAKPKTFEKMKVLAEKLSTLPLPVIIRGETGTGKEVFARFIHNHSPRAERPFIAVNCGAIPENLIESLLFGHAKGSFTGAIDTRKGFFEEADGGTIFLDEIGELPMNMQVKLLRVLQEKHITRVGDNREIPVNVRVISATHVDLEEAVREKRFREDLYFRIQVMPLQLPPLRERGQDVVLLAEEFIKRYGAEYGRGRFKMSRNTEKALLGYHWPGNVRELENRIQKGLVQAVHGVIQPKDIGLDEVQKEAKESPRTLKEAREAVEREVIGRALQDSGANLTLAATILCIDRKVLREIMERLGIKKEDFKN